MSLNEFLARLSGSPHVSKKAWRQITALIEAIVLSNLGRTLAFPSITFAKNKGQYIPNIVPNLPLDRLRKTEKKSLKIICCAKANTCLLRISNLDVYDQIFSLVDGVCCYRVRNVNIKSHRNKKTKTISHRAWYKLPIIDILVILSAVHKIIKFLSLFESYQTR